jgi:hypothetical protein
MPCGGSGSIESIVDPDYTFAHLVEMPAGSGSTVVLGLRSSPSTGPSKPCGASAAPKFGEKSALAAV